MNQSIFSIYIAMITLSSEMCLLVETCKEWSLKARLELFTTNISMSPRYFKLTWEQNPV